jgi:hypothetical protein
MSQAWIIGAVASVMISILLVIVKLPIRRKLYEFFLASHVVFTMVVLIAVFTIIFFTESKLVIEFPLYMVAAHAVWFFDRILRLIRLQAQGFRIAQITVLDAEYIRVHIPNVEAQGHGYVYFPTLTWRIWENHPFSVLEITENSQPGLVNPLTSELPASISFTHSSNSKKSYNGLDDAWAFIS